MFLVFVMIFAAIPNVYAADYNTNIAFFETNQDNVPVRAGYTDKDEIVRRIKTKGTIVVVYDTKVNQYNNTWYRTTDGWVYSARLESHNHKASACTQPAIKHPHLMSDTCTCGLRFNTKPTFHKNCAECKKLLQNNPSAKPSLASMGAIAATGVIVDGPLPIGDIISFTLILVSIVGSGYGGTIELTDYQKEVNDYIKEKNIYYIVERRLGGFENQKGLSMTLENAVIAVSAGLDVYTNKKGDAELLAMTCGDYYGPDKDNKPGYYFHYHLGTRSKQWGGHIFYGNPAF